MTDWYTTGAEIAAAFGTFGLAAITARLAHLTRKAVSTSEDAVEAANRTAQAAKEGADATKSLAMEAQTDRELAWRPYLTIELTRDQTGGEAKWTEDVTIVNIGTGPAIECGYFVYRKNSWANLAGFSIRAGSQHDLSGVAGAPPGDGRFFPEGMFDTPGGTSEISPRPAVRVAVCKDILGNRWRFFEGHVPECIRRDEPSPPPWLRHAPW